MKNYEAIIVGTGAAGGIVACVLAEAGKRILLLERGAALSFNDVGRDPLRNQRLSVYGHNAGPELVGNPRVFVDPNGNSRTVKPHEPDYHNNAACLGGGTRVYGAQAWRFSPDDFRMATKYGIPEGSSLADWPFSYETLEPFYERAEWELGVAGADNENSQRSPRKRNYPLPPVPHGPQTIALTDGARGLGWQTTPVPLLINTEPYQGRAACIACKYCVGFACPTDAKNGSHNTVIPRALATGNCNLVTGAIAERIEVDLRGNVSGVSYFVDSPQGTTRETAQSKCVIVSAGAIESARLLLNSTSAHHPSGLGNDTDQVGRNLQGHLYPRAYGISPTTVFNGVGPGVTIATTEFNHDNPGIVGGGMLADDFIKPPIDFWYDSLPPDLPRWGLANKQFMRDNYTRVLHVRGPVQDIPNPEGRVTTDNGVRDKWGIPVARLSGTTHPATVIAAEFMRARGEDWLRASGCEKIWSSQPGLVLSGKQHQAGTCRMGIDPRASVTDEWGRVHSHDNLFVVDGSLHVTNGGFNPVLTIQALAFRSAEYIARTL
ncbi:MAG TPA: GMC family oxidoreductase [Pyrinomonadaceae bacterium]|jgi:Choline dehydrogenase and related flavoproteins|nr:GMC family oxidoreductase [Pyrinomonadaceae bacterium]